LGDSWGGKRAKEKRQKFEVGTGTGMKKETRRTQGVLVFLFYGNTKGVGLLKESPVRDVVQEPYGTGLQHLMGAPIVKKTVQHFEGKLR